MDDMERERRAAMDRQRGRASLLAMAALLAPLGLSTGCASGSHTVMRGAALDRIGARAGIATVELGFGAATESVTVHSTDDAPVRYERPRSVQVDARNLWIHTCDGLVRRVPVAEIRYIEIHRMTERDRADGADVASGAIQVAGGALCILAMFGGHAC